MKLTKVYIQLLNTYRSFASELEKEGISRNLQQTEEWLYEDGVDESEKVYTEKLEDLKKVLFVCKVSHVAFPFVFHFPLLLCSISLLFASWWIPLKIGIKMKSPE